MDATKKAAAEAARNWAREHAPAGKPHEVTITMERSATVENMLLGTMKLRTRHTALCVCGWRAQSTHEEGEVRVGRKADRHIKEATA